MGSKDILICTIVLAAAALLVAGCPGTEETTIINQIPGEGGSFPGTPASASNLAEDAKALSPGGQDVTAVRVFWDGHDAHRAVVLFETRAFLAEEKETEDLGTTTKTTTNKIYYRHLWATHFDGARLTPPVELVGENMMRAAFTSSYVTVDQSTLEEVDRGTEVPWRDLTDTATVLFHRPSATGAFGADPSSADAEARKHDAVILFRAPDVDTDTGVVTANVTGEQLGTGDGLAIHFSGNLANRQVDPNSVLITDGFETFTDDGAGTLNGNKGGTGSITYRNGAYSVTFDSAPDMGDVIDADYDWNYEKDTSNERLYRSYFDHSQRGVARADTQDVVGTGASSEREFRHGFMTRPAPLNDEVSFPSVGPTVHSVQSFGVLADGFLGQAWWGTDDNDYDDGATFSHFLVAVWTEMVAGYDSARGVIDRFTSTPGPGNEHDRKLMASVYDLETGTFGAPQEIKPDAGAAEHLSGISGVRSDGDSILHERFITYDNQVFFTYADAAVDDDPNAAPNWDYFAGAEGVDTALAWNLFELSTGTTSGDGAFLTDSLLLSPAHRSALIDVDLGGSTSQDLPDIAWETVNELTNDNGRVVFGADEGLEVTYIFFTQVKQIPGSPSGTPLDDNDLFVAQLRHNESTHFTPGDDRLEVDTLDDDVTVVTETGGNAIHFDTAAHPNDDELLVGTGYLGPVLDEKTFCLVTVGSDTRLVVQAGGAGPSTTAFMTYIPAGTPNYLDEDFSSVVTDQTVAMEHWGRSVKNDWRIVLNKSAEWFLILYRQQDAKDQALGTFTGTGNRVVNYTPDIGLYASRLATTRAGGTPQALSGQALVGTDAVRLDDDSPTEDPTASNQVREDAVAFLPQHEMDPPIAVQSDLDRISVLFVTIDDNNTGFNEARNTTTSTSQDLLKIVQVENGASSLALHPSQGGAQVAQYPFNHLTSGKAGAGMDESLDEFVAALDAGVDGDVVVYYKKPTASEITVGGISRLPSPPDVRIFAANFGGGSLTTQQISSPGGTGEKQALGFMPPITRGFSAQAASGRHHLMIWIEDPASGTGDFVGGGALMSLRYHKAVPEDGDTTANLVNADGSFTPSVTASGYAPLQIDFQAGDTISFPLGAGFDQGDVGVYFTQFGEIYYNEYSESSGSWWTDDTGLPAPTLLSHEGFPGVPGTFVREFFQGDSDLFLGEVFGNYILEDFTGTIGGTQLACLRYDNLHKALVFYAKDDGGWDAENDGTGYNRLFCRIRD